MDSWQNLIKDANEWEIAFNDFCQNWITQNTASTSHIEFPNENIEVPFSNLPEPSNQNDFLHTPNVSIHTEPTFQPTSSIQPEPVEENNRALGKQPMSDSYTPFVHPVKEVYQEASTSNLTESTDELLDQGPSFDWLVKDSWDFICDYDRKVEKRLEKKRSAEPSTSEDPQVVRSKRPYKLHKRDTTLELFGELTDISWLPAPVCSCTGIPIECYRWGKGGWASACCTATFSMYPLPTYEGRSRKVRRMIGRKMSLGPFSRVIEELCLSGYDFRIPIDLKDRWAQHGTNKFLVLK